MQIPPDYEGFAKQLLRNFFPDAHDISGADFQDTAEAFGIIKPVPYDRKKHGNGPGDDFDLPEGENIFVPNY